MKKPLKSHHEKKKIGEERKREREERRERRKEKFRDGIKPSEARRLVETSRPRF